MKLKQARVRSGMSQEELANRVHLSVSMIQSIENGRRDGSTKTLIALAAALNTTPNDLLYGTDNTISTSKHIHAQREEVAR
ncbi:prophage P2a protein 10, phage Cro/CI family transcriptional regulator [Lacticaseibacillus paracasei subsp. paracasei Lpp125]|uniref:helix-turn-helix domain-containing protein n=1 Tax=Lacticaseibacillus paracasei TaxID=1597 RepID=UPI000343C87C|nr:helix-turn-helix transcriptional regulator [Lacticaseibacillus paracasei]EPD02484.1 prophage P2a protein 10, phage Cro/CI family transcriptional regulator [Lacticaseibacillus paracasei subsp. paracasei Lpp125]